MPDPWFKKASVQTAIVAGFFALLAAGITVGVTHYTKSCELRTQKFTEIEQSIAKVGDSINEANRESAKIDLTPALETETDTQQTLERINNEGMTFYSKVNLFAIHNLIRAYGKPTTQEHFGHLLNEASIAHTALAQHVAQHVGYLSAVRACEDGALAKITNDYIRLLNNRNSKRSEFFSFLASLTRDDFEPR